MAENMRLVRWRRFWWRSIVNAVPWAKSVTNAVLSVATAAFLVFGVGLRIWPGRGLTGPPITLAFAALLFLCHGAYVTWRKEVDGPTHERDEARRIVASQEEELERVHANARTWEMLARLNPLIHDRRVPDGLARLRSVDPTTDPSYQFRFMQSLGRVLHPWSTDVRMAPLEGGHQQMADRFDATGDSNPTTLEQAEEVYAARLHLVKAWVNGDDDLVAPKRLDFLRRPRSW